MRRIGLAIDYNGEDPLSGADAKTAFDPFQTPGTSGVGGKGVALKVMVGYVSLLRSLARHRGKYMRQISAVAAAAAIGMGLAGPAAAQALAGIQIGDSEHVARGQFRGPYKEKELPRRPGATLLLGDNLSVVICRGVVSGIRATWRGDALSYARTAMKEAERQGTGHSSVSYMETGPMRTSLLMTSWRANGFATTVELAAVGSESRPTDMLVALDYQAEPDPCPRS